MTAIANILVGRSGCGGVLRMVWGGRPPGQVKQRSSLAAESGVVMWGYGGGSHTHANNWVMMRLPRLVVCLGLLVATSALEVAGDNFYECIPGMRPTGGYVGGEWLYLYWIYCIRKRGGIYNKIWPMPKRVPEVTARGNSQGCIPRELTRAQAASVRNIVLYFLSHYPIPNNDYAVAVSIGLVLQL